MPSIVYLILLLILIEILSTFYARYLLQFKILRYLIFPGIFFHELCHYLACKITLAKVDKFSFGWREGEVVHSPSPIPFIGGLIISLAPLAGGIIALYYLFFWLSGWSIGAADVVSNIATVSKIFGSINFFSWQFALFVYLALNLLAVVSPSRQDYKNIILGLILYIVLSFFLPILNQVNNLFISALSILAIIQLLVVAILRILLFLNRKI